MPSFNQVTVMGNLTDDPKEIQAGGATLAKFSIAVTDYYNSKDGGKHNETSFFRVEAWNRTAENVLKYVRKGACVLVSGKLKQESWEDKDGNKRSNVVVRALDVRFMPSDKRENAAAPKQSEYEEQRPETDDVMAAGNESLQNLPF